MTAVCTAPPSPVSLAEMEAWTSNLPLAVLSALGVNFSPASPCAALMNAPSAIAVTPSF